MNVIDIKLIDAWYVLCMVEDDGVKEVSDLLELVQVPEEYHKEVSIKVARRRIKVLSQGEQASQ